MKINSEILTAFTCSAVYDMATSTTLPPASSPSLDDGGMPTPIAQECTTIPVLLQMPPAADATTLPILPIIIVSEDPYKNFSDIYSAPTALLPSRTCIGYYGFTSPFTGIDVIAPITPRTGICVNNELLQQCSECTGIGVTAPITPRTGIGVPLQTAGSSIAFPMAVSAYAGLYAFSPAALDNDYYSSSDSPDNPHRRSFYTYCVYISVLDNPIGVQDNQRKRYFHRWTYAALGG